MLQKFWSLVSLCSGVFKKALCFLSRKRRPSGDGFHPMTRSGSGPTASSDDASWDSWEAEGFTVSVDPASKPAEPPRSQQYLGNPLLSKQQMPAEDEDHNQYFADMTPEFKKPAKILVRDKQSSYHNGSSISERLSFTPDPQLQPELEAWQEDTQTGGGWDAEDEDVTDEVIRLSKQEQRRARNEERSKRLEQQRKLKTQKLS